MTLRTGSPPPSILQAHPSTSVSLEGGDWGLVSASSSACITVWPAAFLRHAAEASGFVLPSREEVQLELKRLDGRNGSFRLPNQQQPAEVGSARAGRCS